MNIKTKLKIDTIMLEAQKMEDAVKSVCSHAQYCGNGSNDYYGNAIPHNFICRKNMLKYNRHDGLIMVEPFTNKELKEAFKKYCICHYGEFCKIAESFIKSN